MTRTNIENKQCKQYYFESLIDWLDVDVGWEKVILMEHGDSSFYSFLFYVAKLWACGFLMRWTRNRGWRAAGVMDRQKVWLASDNYSSREQVYLLEADLQRDKESLWCRYLKVTPLILNLDDPFS